MEGTDEILSSSSSYMTVDTKFVAEERNDNARCVKNVMITLIIANIIISATFFVALNQMVLDDDDIVGGKYSR